MVIKDIRFNAIDTLTFSVGRTNVLYSSNNFFLRLCSNSNEYSPSTSGTTVRRGNHVYINNTNICLITYLLSGPSWSYGSWIYNYLCNQCISLLMLWVRISIRARYTILCYKVCQWLATGQWFSLDPQVSSTNKTDRHHRAEILFKVALGTIKQTNKTKQTYIISYISLVWGSITFF